MSRREEVPKWGDKRYHSLDYVLREMFGGKVYKLSLQSGCTCPNRDGTVGSRGCIFCSEGGSGDFAEDAALTVREQLVRAKERIAGKMTGSPAGYIAYFQSFTNTYGPLETLRELFSEAAEVPEVLALSIGTRPDCLPEEMIAVLKELNRKKPVWVELGLQTIHEDSAAFIRRGYPLFVFEDAVRRLKAAGLTVIVHVIVGLPGETKEMIRETVRYLAELYGKLCVNERKEAFIDRPFASASDGLANNVREANASLSADGIKLQLLHILKGTDLAVLYEEEKREAAGGSLRWNAYTMEEYVDLVIDLLELLPPEMVVHRITGDAPKRLLIEPLWSADKKRVLNCFAKRMKERDSFQGKCYQRECAQE